MILWEKKEDLSE